MAPAYTEEGTLLETLAFTSYIQIEQLDYARRSICLYDSKVRRPQAPPLHLQRCHAAHRG